MRDHIIREIRRLAAKNGGQPPGETVFKNETGVAQHHWRGKYWARWGDALTEAGFQPNSWVKRHDSDDVLTGVIAVARHYGRLPTGAEFQLYRAAHPDAPAARVIHTHFSGRDGLIAALAKRAAEDPEYADIAAMLPDARPERPASPRVSSEGWVYLIQMGDFYKVGRSDELERRVKEIRVAMPDKAALVHSIRTDDPPGIEAYWHKRFAEKRANGEWFKLTSADVMAFKKRKFQ